MIDFRSQKVNIALVTLVGFGLSAAFWYAVQACFELLLSEHPTGSGIAIKLILAFVLFCANLAWLGLVGLAVKKRGPYELFVAFSQAGYLVVFWNNPSAWGGYVLLFCAGWFWDLRASKDLATRRYPTITRSLNFGLPFAVTLFLLVIAFSVYFQLQANVPLSGVVASIEDFEVSFMNKIIASQIRGYKPQMSFESFLKAASYNGFLGSFIVGGAKPEQLNPEVLAYLRNKYSQRLGVNISPGQRVGEVLQGVVHQYLTLLLQKYSRFFPFALALILFFVLRILGIFYFMFTKLFALAFYRLLLQAGLVKIETIQAQVEELSL